MKPDDVLADLEAKVARAQADRPALFVGRLMNALNSAQKNARTSIQAVSNRTPYTLPPNEF
jgi:hypothetical protein